MAETSGDGVVLQITRGGVRVGTPEALDQARAYFLEHQGVCLQRFIEPALAATLQRVIDRAEWREKIHYGIDPPPVELCIFDRSVFSRFHLLLNDRRLFDAIETITGCPKVGCFFGRVYRMNPRAGHQDSWHDDMDGRRMIAMSVNLSAAPYGGGVLQVRELDTKRPLWQFHNTGLGDAIVFNLGDNLEHCLTAIEGTTGKTAFAGWFRNSPQYEPWFRNGLRPPHDSRS